MATSGLYDVTALAKECPEHYVKICEGSTAVLFPPAMLKGRGDETVKKRQDEEADDAQAVFYNPAQVVNRDLSICALELFSRLRRLEPPRKGGTTKGITILEALSATGLRAIRYFKEITNVQFVIANDLDPDAVRCIRQNCLYNGVPVGTPTASSNFDLSEAEGGEETSNSSAVIPNLDDAVDLMHRLGTNPGVHPGKRLALLGRDSGPQFLLQQERMDVVDLDPYGSASPFLEAAFRCIKEGGMMLVTSTDSAVLCGNYTDTCHAKYNSVSYKAAHCHEMAVRILLSSIERVANKHRKYIVPLISLHIDFYVRCFVRVYSQPAETKLSPCKLGYQLQCTHCPAFWLRPMTVERHARPKKRKRETPANEDPAVKPLDKTPDEEKLRLELFPLPPSRHTNPRLVCPSLESLTSCNDAKTGEASHPVSCPVCGCSVTVSGPLYCGATQDQQFLSELLKVIDERDKEQKITAAARIKGLVQTALEELPQCPLFYNLPDIASYVKVRCPQTPCFVAALGRLGYHCSQVHCAPSGVKTDCPPDILFSIMLQWKMLQDKADRDEQVTPGSLSQVKLCISPLKEVDFTYDTQYDFRRDFTGIAKFIPNAPGWGPKRRHTGAAVDEPEGVDDRKLH